MALSNILKSVANFAKNNEVRAFQILGARPGPGIDLLIHPVEPMCGKWLVDGLTPCGVAFIGKFWVYQPLSNQKIAEMRKQAREWGLTYETKYSILPIDVIETSKERT